MSQTLHDKIEAYLADEMLPEERQSFEQTMAADPSVAEEVALYQLEREGHELLIEQELREKALSWMGDSAPVSTSEAVTPVTSGQSRKPLFWAIGIALTLLLLWGLYRSWRSDLPATPPPAEVPQGQNPTSPEGQTPATPGQPEPIAQQPNQEPPVQEKPKPVEDTNPNRVLAMAYYEKPDFSGEMRRSGGGDTASSIDTAWAKNDFRKVISLLQNVPTSDPFYFQTREELGHAYFLNKNYAKAAATFAVIRNGGSGEIVDNAAWYEALSWVAAGQSDRAKPLLEGIRADTGHLYHERAVKLLKQMK